MLKAAEVEKRGPVRWVVTRDVQDLIEQGWSAEEFIEIHTAISMGLEEFRFDRNTRIVDITGQTNGNFYRYPLRRRFDEEQRYRDRHHRIKARQDHRLHERGPGRGIPSGIETLALMEKPVPGSTATSSATGRASSGAAAFSSPSRMPSSLTYTPVTTHPGGWSPSTPAKRG